MPTDFDKERVLSLEQELVYEFEEGQLNIEEVNTAWGLLHGLRDYHFYTYGHSLQVAVTSGKIARFRCLPQAEISLEASLHDIGKIGIPKELLDKNKDWNYVDDTERMKPHTEIGYKILIDAGLYRAAYVARTHHCWQEKPHPETLSPFPSQISTPREQLRCLFSSRITSVADQYESLHRKNDMHGSEPLNPSQIKSLLIKGNSDQSVLIRELYRAGILKD